MMDISVILMSVGAGALLVVGVLMALLKLSESWSCAAVKRGHLMHDNVRYSVKRELEP